jgi:hypothetical protein
MVSGSRAKVRRRVRLTCLTAQAGPGTQILMGIASRANVHDRTVFLSGLRGLCVSGRRQSVGHVADRVFQNKIWRRLDFQTRSRVCPVTRSVSAQQEHAPSRPASPAKNMLGPPRWRRAARRVGLIRRPGGMPEPMGGREHRHSANPTLHPSCRPRGVHRLGHCARRCRAIAAPLVSRHPARQEGKRFRRADGALLRIMDFFAIETYTRDAQLHTCSLR